MKSEELEKKIQDLQEFYEKGFQIVDIFYGLITTFLCCGLLIWIPILGWVLIPFVLVIFPFFGTHFRKKSCLGQIKRLKKTRDLLKK